MPSQPPPPLQFHPFSATGRGFVSALYLSLTLSPKCTLSEVSILSDCNATLSTVSGASVFEEVFIFHSKH